MPALVKIALRNLVEHKGKTLIVGIIVALGMTILVAGNSFLDSAARSLRSSFMDSFAGQVFISGKARGNVSLFGVMEMGAGSSTPILPDLARIASYLGGSAEVKSFTFQLTGAEQLNKVGEDAAGGGPFVYLFGIDAPRYSDMFDNLTFVSGAWLVPDQEGILLSTSQAREFRKELGTDLRVGDSVLIQSFGNAIRRVTVRGIFDFKKTNAATDLIAYIDPETLRALRGMASGAAAPASLDSSETLLLSMNEGSLFGSEGDMVTTGTAAAHASRSKVAPADGPRAQAVTASGQAAGPWEFILVSLKNPDRAPAFISQTNVWLHQQGIAAQAGDWVAAAGPFAEMPSMLRVVFSLAVLIIAIVALIIIMNTLVVSIGERSAEIGTMRALGAHKGFVRRMLFVEVMTIVVLFGAAGMGIGSLLVGVMNAAGIRAAGTFMQIMAGGATLRPTVRASTLGISWLLIAAVSVLAQIYPVRTALRIQPVTAMQTRLE